MCPARSRVIPGAVAATCTAMVTAATAVSLWPLLGPMSDEFHWQLPVLQVSLAVSLAVSAITFFPLLHRAPLAGVRAMVFGGCFTSGGVMLLVVPNLTHLWQFWLVLVALGATRSIALAGCWRELKRALPERAAPFLAIGAAAGGGLLFTPWISELVYRNSWREGAAACAGLLLAVATPIAYILLPGTEAG